MLLLIMHVITPLNKAQRAVVFVIKLQIKADLEEEKNNAQWGTGAISTGSHISLQISHYLWLCLSTFTVYGPKLCPVLFFSFPLSLLALLPARCLSLAAHCSYKAMRNIVPFTYKCSLSIRKQQTRRSSLKHILSCCWPCWLFSFTMQETRPIIYGSENCACSQESAI